jgi:hypothetical protein
MVIVVSNRSMEDALGTMALHHIKDDNKCEGPSFIEGDVQDTQKEP